MDKIEVNEYIKTKDGKIGIFDRYSSRKETSIYKSSFNCFIRLPGRKTPLQCDRQYIIKHSKDISDLIEKDDYVNGCRVYEVEEKGITVYQKVEDSSTDYNYIPKDEIKTIWTKEQLKTIEYNIN